MPCLRSRVECWWGKRVGVLPDVRNALGGGAAEPHGGRAAIPDPGPHFVWVVETRRVGGSWYKDYDEPRPWQQEEMHDGRFPAADVLGWARAAHAREADEFMGKIEIRIRTAPPPGEGEHAYVRAWWPRPGTLWGGAATKETK